MLTTKIVTVCSALFRGWKDRVRYAANPLIVGEELTRAHLFPSLADQARAVCGAKRLVSNCRPNRAGTHRWLRIEGG